MNPSLFIRTFQSYFRKPDASTPEELLVNKHSYLETVCMAENQTPILGLMKIEELLSQPQTADVLAGTYHFTPISYYGVNH